MTCPTNAPLAAAQWRADRLRDAEIEAIANVEPGEFLALVEMRRRLFDQLGLTRWQQVAA